MAARSPPNRGLDTGDKPREGVAGDDPPGDINPVDCTGVTGPLEEEGEKIAWGEGRDGEDEEVWNIDRAEDTEEASFEESNEKHNRKCC